MKVEVHEVRQGIEGHTSSQDCGGGDPEGDVAREGSGIRIQCAVVQDGLDSLGAHGLVGEDHLGVGELHGGVVAAASDVLVDLRERAQHEVEREVRACASRLNDGVLDQLHFDHRT